MILFFCLLILVFNEMVKHLDKNRNMFDFNPRFPPKSRIFFIPNHHFLIKNKIKKRPLGRFIYIG